MDTKVHQGDAAPPLSGVPASTSILKLPKITSVTAVTNNITSQTANQYPNSNRFQNDVAKLEAKLEANEKCEKEILEVKSELIKTIVYTMMHNNDSDWETLNEHFKIAKRVKSYLERDLRLNHYLERIYFQTSRALDREVCVDVLSTISEMFPQYVDHVRANGTPRSFACKPFEKVEKPLDLMVPDPKIDFFEGKVDPYKNELKNVKFRPTQGPTVKDLNGIIPKVAYESFKLESNWKDKVSTMTLATSLNLNELEDEPRSTQRNSDLSLKELFKASDDDKESVFEINYIPQNYAKEAPDFEEKSIGLTGREMAIHLLKSTHLAEAISYHLNYANIKLYRPYDLITVPRSQVDEEHFVFSVFGVLRIVPGEENDQLSLDDWNRHAILFDACSEIKFFKIFLYRKFFDRWRKNKKFSQFRKLRKSVSQNIILNIPIYSEAMLLISKLVQELTAIEFLPNQNEFKKLESKKIKDTYEMMERSKLRKRLLENSTFSLERFLATVGKLGETSDETLHYFFAYVRYILDFCRVKFFDKLRFYEKLVNIDDPNELYGSPSLIKAQKLKREEELTQVHHQISLLGNFMDLISVYLGSSMLQVTRFEIERFKDDLNECIEAKREPFFTAELGFDEEDTFSMVPGKKKFVTEVMAAIHNIRKSIISASKLIDFEGSLRDLEIYGFKIIKPKEKLEEEEELKNLRNKYVTQYDYETIINSPKTINALKKPALNKNKDYDESLLDIRLVIPHQEKRLKIYNYILKAQANPLKPVSIASILNSDEKLQRDLMSLETMILEAANEIQAYCDENRWVTEIKLFIKRWSLKLASEWKAIGTFEIDDQLNRIRSWIDNVRNNIDKTLITTNKLLKVDSSPVETILVPNLESIYNQLCEFVVSEADKDIKNFIASMKKIIQELSQRPTNIEEFANYSKHAKSHKSNIPNHESAFTMNKNLYEIIRVNYRALSSDEEHLDAEQQELWKSFLHVVQESVEYVNTQSPNILEQLDHLFKKYVQELQKIHHRGTTGKYLDPYEDSNQILEELKTLCYDFAAVEKILRQCAQWRELITQKTEDLNFITRLSDELTTRKELWKYYQVTFHHIKDWKNTPIKKLNVKRVEEKLKFWQNEAQQLKKKLSNADDRVWENWWNLMESFIMNMKWISKLASDTFKTENFEELFAAIGLDYDPNKIYTVQDLIDLKLNDYVDLINAIYKRAYLEQNNIQQFNQVEDLLNNKLKFKLAKHFDIKLYDSENFKLSKAASTLINRKLSTPSGRVSALKSISKQQVTEQNNLIANYNYKLVDLHEIRYSFDDALIRLNLILQSQVKLTLKERVQNLMLKINEISLLANIWLEVQHMWLFLEKVFNQEKYRTKTTQDFITFERIVDELKEFQFEMASNPIVSNILKDNGLRAKFEDWHSNLKNICQHLESEIEERCIEFPRFYFVSQKDLIETLGYSRDCRLYIDMVRKCFKGVKDLIYELPEKFMQTPLTKDVKNLKQLNFDINASELEVVGLIGNKGTEKMKFFTTLRLETVQHASTWFDSLLKLIKSSLCRLTQLYLDKMEIYSDYSMMPILTKRMANTKDFPVQSILLSEAIIWCKFMTKILETNRIDELKYVINYFNKSINEFSNMQLNPSSSEDERELGSKLILWMISARDITQELSQIKTLHSNSYEWLRTLKHNCEKRVVLRNGTDEKDNKTVVMFNNYENFTVNQMTANIYYDFEYNDASSPMAITPISEKCFLNLTAALNSFRCATLVGSDSVGKKETVKMLSHACGQHLMEINCDNELTSNITGRYMKGLACSGSWVLLNNINNLRPTVLSSIAYELEYLRNSIKSLMNKDPCEQVTSNSVIKPPNRPSTARKEPPRLERVKTVPFNSTCYGLKTYFEDPYVDAPTIPVTKKVLKPAQLKLKAEETRRIEELINNRSVKPDLHYQRKWLGYVRYQGRIIQINANYGCFITASSFESLPENLKTNLRVFNMIEPDYKHAVVALLTCYGLNQGFTPVETIANRIVDFFNQVSTIIENDFLKNSRNLNVIANILKLTALKFKQDKGRQERTLCLILSCYFYPNLKTQTEKSLLNGLLKKIFDYDATSFVEELLTNVIKDQIFNGGLILSSSQVQKMVDFYTATRFNPFVVVTGSSISGKSTIWKVLVKSINSYINSSLEVKTNEVFKKYSMLVNYLNEDQKFSSIIPFHLFPKSAENIERDLSVDNLNELYRVPLMNKLIKDDQDAHQAIDFMINSEEESKNIKIKKIERWIILDSPISEKCVYDQLTSLTQETSGSAKTKFIYETTSLGHMSPSVISKLIIIVQEELEWQLVLEARLNDLCLKYCVPQSKYSIVQDLAKKFFTETEIQLKKRSFRSIIHGNVEVNKMNMSHFILVFANLFDCLMNRFIAELKEPTHDDIANWRAMRTICQFAYFWSFAMFIYHESDMVEFNRLACDIMIKLNCEIAADMKLNESEIDMKGNRLIQFQRTLVNSSKGSSLSAKEYIINEYQYAASLFKLCVQNSQPTLVYGDIGIGKTAFIEKLLTNKFDHIKVSNGEPSGLLYQTLLKHSPYCRNRLNATFNAHKYNFIYFVDDLNLNLSCSKSTASSSLELARQLLETQSLYSHEHQHFLPLSEINFAFACSYPNKSSSINPLSPSHTKNLVCVHLNPNHSSLIESVFTSPIQHWLEEFPPDSIKYPTEMAQTIIKALNDIYRLITEHFKATPSSPHYLFNFKDISKVVQGILLMASKSKVIPIKISKKNQQDIQTNQVITVVKLFCHEVLRVFGDRMIDVHDERILKSFLMSTVENNFCTPKEMETFISESKNSNGMDHSSANSNDQFKNESPTNETQNQLSDYLKPSKKAVTFKAGLINDRNFAPYYGAFLTKDQLALFGEESFDDLLFSKFIIKTPSIGSKTAASSEKSNYMESSITELMNASTMALESYEQSKNLRMNFFFHQEAVRHLARLTRILSLNRGNALLISHQHGSGRTNSVRLLAYLSKMKYYEPRISSDESRCESYLKSILKQACLIAGIKGSNCVVNIKLEYHSHKILENLCILARTGVYPDLFTERELRYIANEMAPTVPALKRVEKTQPVLNSFAASIMDHLHLVISLKSETSIKSLTSTLRDHSGLLIDFYVDNYKPFRTETLESIARFYLALQTEETKAKRMLNKIKAADDDDNELTLKDIQTFSSILAELHSIAYEHYLNVFNFDLNATDNSHKFLSPKPFSVSLFKQISLYFQIYMKRIKDNESFKIKKFEGVFKKMNKLKDKIENYDAETESWNRKLSELQKVLDSWDDKIKKQKEVYQLAVDECRKEEKLVEEMGVALEKLKADRQKNSKDINNYLNPQYDLALKALEELNESDFSELRHYRSPPQRVLAVVNTLCLMFRQPPGWESGKQLLLRPNFFEDLVFYDKQNIPDDIFEALSQICSVETFRPEHVLPGSKAAGSFCAWILAVYRYAAFERTVGNKNRELAEYEELYTKRLTALGEKRVKAEKLCEILESYCASRLAVLKDMKKAQIELSRLGELESKAKHLLELLDRDHSTWATEYTNSLTLIKTYKLDALFTACYISYAGVFDSASREKLLAKWSGYFNAIEHESASPSTTDKADRDSVFIDERSRSVSTRKTFTQYRLRANYNLKDILINSFEHKDTIIQLNKTCFKDEYYVNNALILRELCALPSTMSWPTLYDPEDIALNAMLCMQESINCLKNNLQAEYYNTGGYIEIESPIKGYQESVMAQLGRNLKASDLINAINDSTLAEHPMSRSGEFMIDSMLDNRANNMSLMKNQSESSPSRADSMATSRSSRLSRKSLLTQTSERSSIWEASTFYSRTHTSTTMYHTKSGKQFLNSLNAEYESQIDLPVIETDLNIPPKDNLCIIDSSEPDLDYKLVNAAVHGVAVFLKNAERYQQPNRLIEILLERDFLVDPANNREFLKFGDEEVTISPLFKLILHTNTPIGYNSKSDCLFQRLAGKSNAAHAIIDYAPSLSYISTSYVNSIMEFEISNFMNQYNLSNKIRIESEANIFNRQEQLIERLCSNELNIFDDQSMVGYITDKNDKYKEYTDMLSESSHIDNLLREKSIFYNEASVNVANLYQSLMLLFRVEPAYYTNWSLLKKALVQRIQPIFDEKPITNQARAKQIELASIEIIYNHLAMMMNERHFKLIAFLHQFRTNFNEFGGFETRGGDLASSLASAKPKSSRLTPRKPDRWSKTESRLTIWTRDSNWTTAQTNITRLFNQMHETIRLNEDDGYLINSAEKSEFSRPQPPSFLSYDSWTNCIQLERSSPKRFRGLVESLSMNEKKWIEYFKINDERLLSTREMVADLTSDQIDLLNEMPFDNQLTTIDKLLIWCAIRPDKIGDIMSKFITYSFGGYLPEGSEFEIHSAFEISTASRPLLVFTSQRENAFVNVTLKINQFAEANFSNLKVQIFNLNDEDSKTLKRFLSVLKECVRNGSWLIVENAHLVTRWPREVLLYLYRIKDSKYSPVDYESFSDYMLNIPETRRNGETEFEQNNEQFSFDTKVKVHENFRLWLTIDIDQADNLPLSYIYDAVKIMPRMSNLKRTYEICKKMQNQYKNIKTEFFEEAAILYSLVTHNDFRHDYNWYLKEFHDNMKAFDELNRFGLAESPLVHHINESLLNDTIYGCKMKDCIDLSFAKKLVNQIVIFKKYDITQFIENSQNFYSITKNQQDSCLLLEDLRAVLEICRRQNSIILNDIEAEEDLGFISALNQHRMEKLYSDIKSLQLKESLIENINECVSALINSIAEINNTLETLTLSSTEGSSDDPRIQALANLQARVLVLYHLELQNYKNMFDKLIRMMISLLEFANGSENATSSLLELYEMVKTYRSRDLKLNFFQTLSILIQNSRRLCANLLKELEDNKDILEKTESIDEAKALFIHKIDLNVLYNPSRILTKILYEKFDAFKKSHFSHSGSDAHGPTAVPVDQKIVDMKDKYFLMTVVDETYEQKVQNSSKYSFAIKLQNICIVNAYYETITKSFQPTITKKTCRLPLVVLTPVLATQLPSKEHHKYVPLINDDTNQLICIICIKFWHSKKASLSNTKGSENKTGDQNHEPEDETIRKTLQIPINNSIYFTLINKNSQELLKKLDKLSI